MAPRAALGAGCAALARSQVARVLTAKSQSQSRTSYVVSGPGRLTPALLTRPSRPPKRRTASSTTRPGASAVAMSPCSGSASAPSLRSSSTTPSRPADGPMSTAATIAFVPRACASRATRRTVARPMPLAAPVTSTRIVILLGGALFLGRARDGRDLIGEVDLAVVLGLVADLPLRAGQAPEPVRVAADAVDDQERDAVVVLDVFRLHHPDGLLGLVTRREVGAERTMHGGDVAGLDGVEVVVARATDAPLHDLELAAVHLAGGEHEAQQLVRGLRPAVPVVRARRHLRRHHVHAAVPDEPLVVVGGVVRAAHHHAAHALFQRHAVDVVG